MFKDMCEIPRVPKGISVGPLGAKMGFQFGMGNSWNKIGQPVPPRARPAHLSRRGGSGQTLAGHSLLKGRKRLSCGNSKGNISQKSRKKAVEKKTCKSNDIAEMLKAQAIRGKDDVEDDDEGVVNGEEDRLDLGEPDRD